MNMMMIEITNGLIEMMMDEMEIVMDETGEVDSREEEIEENHLVK